MRVLAVGWVSWQGKVRHAFVELGSTTYDVHGDTELLRRLDHGADGGAAIDRYKTLCGITDRTTQETAVVDWTDVLDELDCKRCRAKQAALGKA